MQGIAIRLRVDGDGFQSHLFAGQNNSEGDFATIGDEDLGDHVVGCRLSVVGRGQLSTDN